MRVGTSGVATPSAQSISSQSATPQIATPRTMQLLQRGTVVGEVVGKELASVTIQASSADFESKIDSTQTRQAKVLSGGIRAPACTSTTATATSSEKFDTLPQDSVRKSADSTGGTPCAEPKATVPVMLSGTEAAQEKVASQPLQAPEEERSSSKCSSTTIALHSDAQAASLAHERVIFRSSSQAQTQVAFLNSTQAQDEVIFSSAGCGEGKPLRSTLVVERVTQLLDRAHEEMDMLLGPSRDRSSACRVEQPTIQLEEADMAGSSS